ncbi:hypothetical protein [Candidatus Protofrankia californiensis]|uniref:hypothetical protein n=1 Tax=Candidatus Protofrankia californiensis TaxID=1839754 RepID=UPI00104183B1|nr:hypothetical protein [Candidatus Protofrankia californiensis]
MSAPRWERAAATALPVLLGASAFAVCFARVRHLAELHGQPGWRALVIASTVEAIAFAAVVEIRMRRRVGASISAAVVVLTAGLAMSLAANIADRGPGSWGLVMAAWPVVAFGLVVALKATRPVHGADPALETGLEATADEAAVEAGAGEENSSPRINPAPVPVQPVGTGQPSRRHQLAQLVASVPADDPRSAAQLARQFAPEVGLSESTARRYIGELSRSAS